MNTAVQLQRLAAFNWLIYVDCTAVHQEVGDSDRDAHQPQAEVYEPVKSGHQCAWQSLFLLCSLSCNVLLAVAFIL